MKSFLYSVVIALATLPATAGITYDFRTETTGLQASEQQGRATIDGANLRLEMQTGDGVMFQNGSVAISHNSGTTLDVLDPSAKTYWEIDLASLNPGALAGMVKMTNEKVNVRDAGDGGKIEGFATHHKIVSATADMAVGEATGMHFEVTMESWTTEKIPMDAAAFLQRRMGNTGLPMLDQLIAAQNDNVKGFPLRQITYIKVTQGTSPAMEMRSTTNITNVKKATTPASLFVVPADYRKMASPLEKMMGQ
jgi:hypothetical protein